MLDEQDRQLVVGTQPADQLGQARRPPRGSGRLPARRAAGASAAPRARARARFASASRTAVPPRAPPRAPRARASRGSPSPRRESCARAPGAMRVCAPTRTLSSTLMCAQSCRFWNVRAMPRRTMRCARLAQQVLALVADGAAARLVEARDDVERRRLARRRWGRSARRSRPSPPSARARRGRGCRRSAG